MIAGLPLYLPLLFIAATALTVLLLAKLIGQSAVESVARKTTPVLAGIIGWLVLQAVVSMAGVYRANTAVLPPRLVVMGNLPAIATIVALFFTRGGRAFIDSLPLKGLTWIHIIRVPVEIVLLGLYISNAVPQLMTFEGRNLDILSGITVPLIVFLGFRKRSVSVNVLLTWNIVCLILLLNIVVNAMLSAPFPFQQFAFDQPAVAILYFPFSWLPTFVVPVVLFSHLASIRQLNRMIKGKLH